MQVGVAEKAEVGSFVSVEWARREDDGDGAWHKDIGEVNGGDGNGRKYINIIDDHGQPTGQHIEVPANDNKHIIIKSLVKCRRPPVAIPQQLRRRQGRENLDDVKHIIYVDGGAIQGQRGKRGGGAAAAAMLYVNRETLHTEQHARTYAKTTNNIAEWAAMVAAHRFVKRINSNERVVIIGDSNIVFNAYINAQRPANAMHAVMYAEAKALQARNIEVAHMLRKLDNSADAVVKQAMRVGDIGDPALFPDAPYEPDLPEAAPATGAAAVTLDAATVGASINDIINNVTSVDDFIQAKRFHSRSRCPRGLEAAWSQIVKMQISAIIAAPTIDARSAALIGFMLLPTIFLPTRSSTSKLAVHLNRGRAFFINLSQRPTDGQHAADAASAAPAASATAAAAAAAPTTTNRQRMSFDKRSAVSRRVEQLANDYQIRSAVKLMQANADAPRVAFEEMAPRLEAKFPRRDDNDNFEPRPAKPVAPFSAAQVHDVIKKMAKGAATAIDGWTSSLLMQASMQDFSIAEDLGTVLSWVAASHGRPQDQQCMHFNTLAMDIVRAARLVGIPKDGGGVRPIVISSFIAKLTGALVLRGADVKPLDCQYAIARPDGAKTIIHETRHDYDNGAAVIRIDASNAYNITKRKRILEMLLDNQKYAGDVATYFNTMYEPAARLVFYGPGGKTHIVTSDEGVRQGDALSSFYFCIVLERVCAELRAKYPNKDVVSIRCYMDDMTITAPPDIAIAVMHDIVALLEQYGFVVNCSKSAAICKTPIVARDDAASPFEIVDPTQPFKMLGANITNNYTEMNHDLERRILNFFDSLDALDVHPEIKHTILHLCGKPKLIYFCETTPPQHSRHVVDLFERRAKRSFAHLIGVGDVSEISDDALYNIRGADMPRYSTNSDQLYTNALTVARSGIRAPPARLASTQGATTFPETSYDRCWSHYLHAALHEQLPPAIYTTALAIRVNVIPDGIRQPLPTRCNCTVICRTHAEVIAHAIHCESMSRITYAVRHTFVKSALSSTARRYGITVTNEPGFYVYGDGSIRHRPDLTFHVYGDTVATDITIVTPVDDAGTAAHHAADAKTTHHAAAVRASHHDFIPFALETNGHLDKRCFHLVDKIARHVPQYERHWFARDMIGAASSAVAQYRAQALLNANLQHRALTF